MSSTSSPEAGPAEVDPAGPRAVEQPNPQEAELPDQFEGEIPFPQDVELLPALREVKPTETSPVQKLPHSLLVQIFRYLDFKSLYEVQFVNNIWKQCSVNAALWDYHRLHITKYTPLPDVNLMLENLPSLKKISTPPKFFIPKDIFLTVVNNTSDLREFNCSFDPPITSEDINILTQRHVNIYSIRLDLQSQDTIQSVHILDENTHIKEISIICSDVQNDGEIVQRSIDVCNLLHSFDLEKIDICGLNMVKDDTLNSALSHVLDRFSAHLKCLSLDLYPNESLFNNLTTCHDLVELKCNIKYIENIQYSLNISDLRNLRSLSLKMLFSYNGGSLIPNFKQFVNNTFINSFHQQSFLNLTSLKLSVDFAYIDGSHIFNRILELLVQLKELNVVFYTMKDVSNAVMKLENLRHLEKFSLSTRSRISSEGLSYIGICHSICYLKLKGCLHFNNGSSKRKDSRVQDVIAMIHSLTALKFLYLIRCDMNRLSATRRGMITSCCTQRSVKLTYRL